MKLVNWKFHPNDRKTKKIVLDMIDENVMLWLVRSHCLILIIIYICIKKYRFEPHSKCDREYDFDAILG